ncbi:hypothetical protein Aperf_G00000047798 [Anoplocephala perfoliata]
MEEKFDETMEEYVEGGDNNASNSTAWMSSKSMYCINSVDIPRNTSQTMVLIIFNLTENHFGAFRNEMIINLPVFKAYGHGEYHGLSKNVRCVEGSFPSNSGIAVLSFDNKQEAVKCLQSKTQMREANWMGVPEVYIVPLCNPMRSINDWEFMQVDFYDIKHGVNFTKYLNTVENLVHKKGGLIVAGTSDVKRFRGVCKPAYIVVYQWCNIDQAECFNRELDSILLEAGAACATRAIFEMDPFTHQYLD